MTALALETASLNNSTLIESFKLNFVDSDTNSNKFYNVYVMQHNVSNEYTVYRHYGRIDSKTTPQPIMYTAFSKDAIMAAQKAISAKQKKGYEITNHYQCLNAYSINTQNQIDKNNDLDAGRGVYVSGENNTCYLLCRKQVNGNTYLSCYDENEVDSPWRTCAVAVSDIALCDETYFAQVMVVDKQYEGLQEVLIIRSIEDIEDVDLEEEDCQLPA